MSTGEEAARSTPAPERTPSAAVFPLGAHPDGTRTRFAVTAARAEAVQVCLLEPDPRGGPLVERRVELTERTFGVWHGSVDGLADGQRYGYRVHGRYDPAAGLRHNPAKLLVDPYARRISGALTDLDAARGYLGDPMTGPPSPVDSAGAVPLSVLTTADPGGPPDPGRPEVPWADTVIYELHVRGYTRCHPEVPPELRGSYLGLAHPVVLDHLRGLGVTAVELLPVHAIADEPGLLARGMRNYWGYSTLGFLAPHAGYASVPGREVEEFRTLVAALHGAGIEVILDVVYNHTCEGDVTGPTLSFRGLDALGYYAHSPTGESLDITGCGNTLDAGSLTVARLVGDSLRYWADLGVDGFRFDLASVLGRPRAGAFDPAAGVLSMIAADPVLAGRKLIAEPWDATGEGYRVGGFGAQWSEWNGRYRDAVRDFWRGRGGLAELATRVTGSEDLYAASGRRPWASINFVTAHDGFTIRDLVSYQRKHNEANGEDDRDGTDDNRSRNFGVEGDSDSAAVLGDRLGTVRAALATLLLSTGVPMLTAGDELWRTQGGNNNAYCQDNEVSWVDWSRPGAHPGPDAGPAADIARLRGYVSRLVRARRHIPGRDAFFGPTELTWWHRQGRVFTEADWRDGELRTVGAHVPNGALLILHAGDDPVTFRLPDLALTPVLDSATPDGDPTDATPRAPGDTVEVSARTVLLLIPHPP